MLLTQMIKTIWNSMDMLAKILSSENLTLAGYSLEDLVL